MSCDNSDYSYATKYSLGHNPVSNMTELLEEPVEEKPEQVGLKNNFLGSKIWLIN